MIRSKIKYATVCFILLLGISCGGGEDILLIQECEAENLRAKLGSYNRDTDFTLILESEHKNAFTHSVGNSTSTTSYQSASTSKWVTSVVILSLIEDEILHLDDNPQDYIDFWPSNGALSTIKLRHLLSFTSGLEFEPICINLPNAVFENCVMTILDKNQTIPTPGTTFYYGSSHMQVAGLMAMKATGLDSWEAVFDAFKMKTGLFLTSEFDLPSLQNPRLAGGMHWTGEEYMAFLNALYYEKILTPELITFLNTDQIANSTIIYSPVLDGINQDWHYALGNWIECNNTTFNCTTLSRLSSPGAFGAYPFIDYENKYFGIIARQGAIGTFSNGYNLFKSIELDVIAWSNTECN